MNIVHIKLRMLQFPYPDWKIEWKGGDGPALCIRILQTNQAICGLIPVDDESDDRFVDFMLNEVKTAVKAMEGG